MRELGSPIAASEAKLYKALRDAGLLPNNVIDFSIDNPLNGTVTITCKYHVDEKFNEIFKEHA